MVLNIFSCAYWPLVYLLMKCPFKSFTHFWMTVHFRGSMFLLQLGHFLPMWPWTGYIISLCFNSFTCKVEKRSFTPSVQFSRSVVSDSLWPHESQHARPPCPSPTPRVHPNSCASSRWCHPAISSSVVPFSSAPNPSQHQGLFQWVSSSHEVAKVLEFQLQHRSFQWTPRTGLL